MTTAQTSKQTGTDVFRRCSMHHESLRSCLKTQVIDEWVFVLLIAV